MKNKKVIIIVFIIVIGALILSLGMCGKQEDKATNHTGKEEMLEDENKNLDSEDDEQVDESQDVQVEEFEDEFIIIPSSADDSSEAEDTAQQDSIEDEIVKDEEDDVQSAPVQEGNVESGIELGENELPFVPAE